jgi:hypothetical protein
LVVEGDVTEDGVGGGEAEDEAYYHSCVSISLPSGVFVLRRRADAMGMDEVTVASKSPAIDGDYHAPAKIDMTVSCTACILLVCNM